MFEVGQKVKIIEFKNPGPSGIVECHRRYDGDNIYLVNIKDYTNWYTEDELVSANIATEEDLW
jgi:hypothetical protein